MKWNEIIEYKFFSLGEMQLSIYHLLVVLFIIVGTKVLIWFVSRLLKRYFARKKIDVGRQYALFQIIKYIIYTSATLLVLESVGISLSVLWGGAAALLVGIGLGLQQTFNDLVSGIILLSEGSVDVGDIVAVDDTIGRVQSIGIRTSKVETRDNVSILIPNSKLVGDKSINWSHNSIPSRFRVNVGVAYASDIDLVTNLLFQAADENNNVLKSPEPEVQFRDFGSSALEFILFFYSEDYMSIESIKSELRYAINRLFKTNGVEIPFPQQDVWFKNAIEYVDQNVPVKRSKL